jgi:hypothetical protein
MGLSKYVSRLVWVLVWVCTVIPTLVSLGVFMALSTTRYSRIPEKVANWFIGKLLTAAQHINKTTRSGNTYEMGRNRRQVK